MNLGCFAAAINRGTKKCRRSCHVTGCAIPVTGGEIIRSALANHWDFVIAVPILLFAATALLAWRGRHLKRKQDTYWT